MYIRETLTRRTANNTYRSVRLVEGRRVGRKVQQKTLLNLGTGFSIPKAQWPELVEIIESKLAGNEYLFEPAPELAATAESIVQRLRSRELEKPTGNCSPRYAARSYCLIMSAAFPSSAIRMASIGLYPSSAIESR